MMNNNKKVMVVNVDSSVPYEEHKSRCNNGVKNFKGDMCNIIDPSIPYEARKIGLNNDMVNVQRDMCIYVDPSVPYEERKLRYKWDNSIVDEIDCVSDDEVQVLEEDKTMKEMVKIVNKESDSKLLMPRKACSLNPQNKTSDIIPKIYGENDAGFTFVNNTLSYNGEPFLNCAIEITDLVVGEKRSFYRCKIYIKGNPIIKDVSVSEYSSATWVNGIPGIAYMGTKYKSKELLFIYLQKLVSDLDLSKQIRLYRKPGWYKLNEKYFYVTPAGVIGDETIKATSEYGQKFSRLLPIQGSFRKYLQFINTTKSHVATILVLYLSMNLVNYFYRDCDFTPRFSLFVHGERGSFKTSLSLALSQIEYKDTPTYTLKGTKAGLEAGYRNYKDNVMIIDDLAPTLLNSDRKSMLSKLENVVRAFGDGTGCVRNTDFLDKEKALEIDNYLAEGGACFTGEFFEGCESSLARCVFLSLNKNDVDLFMLSQLQNDKHIVENFAIEFISNITYLVNNTNEDIFSFIKMRGKEIRKNHSLHFKNERYGEYIAQLQVAGELLMYVAGRFNLLNQDEIDNYTKRFSLAINEVICENNHKLSIQTPLTVVYNAIYYNLDSENCAVLRLGETIGNLNNVILVDDEFCYITQKVCKTLANEYIKDNGITMCEFTSTSVADVLHSADIIKYYQEGKVIRKGKKMPGYGSMRFMKISKKKLSENIDFSVNTN